MTKKKVEPLKEGKGYFIRHFDINKILTFLSVVIAFISLILSSYSIKQSKIDSIHSDSLFNVQKKINDLQLINSQEQLLELKNLSKPRLIMEYFVNNYSDEEVNGALTLKNVGHREAQNLNYKSYLIQLESSKISDLSEGQIKTKLSSEESYIFRLHIKSPFKVSEKFFIYVSVNYFDALLNKDDSIEHYFRYALEDGDNTNTNQKEISKIQELIKQIK